MKKLTLVAILTTLFLITTVMAQLLPKITIDKIGLLGKGLAISESDSKDVHEVKIGIATVKVNSTGQESNVSAGVLYFDNIKYKLKNVTISNKTASGDIYSNDTLNGTFQVVLLAKPKTDFWSGSLNLNNKNYNLYMLEGKRIVKATELRDKVSNYCTAHHEDKNCKEKIHEFCESNPQDARCITLFRNYCRTHLEEEQCRQTLRELCGINPNSEICKEYCENNPNICGVRVKKCENCPEGYKPTDDGFCAPNCKKGKRDCPHDTIKCPSVTTTTTSQTTTTTTSPTTTTTTPTTTTTTSETTTTTSQTTSTTSTTTTTETTTTTTTTTTG